MDKTTIEAKISEAIQAVIESIKEPDQKAPEVLAQVIPLPFREKSGYAIQVTVTNAH